MSTTTTTLACCHRPCLFLDTTHTCIHTHIDSSVAHPCMQWCVCLCVCVTNSDVCRPTHIYVVCMYVCMYVDPYTSIHHTYSRPPKPITSLQPPNKTTTAAAAVLLSSTFLMCVCFALCVCLCSYTTKTTVPLLLVYKSYMSFWLLLYVSLSYNNNRLLLAYACLLMAVLVIIENM